MIYSALCQEAKNELRFLQAEETLEAFQEYMRYQGKSYQNIEEFNIRFAAFKTNYEASVEKAVQKLSKFMDYSKDEFKKKYLNFKFSDVNIKNAEIFQDHEAEEPKEKTGRTLQASPTSFDWRNQGIVSSVKDQGECGVCWAFSAAANIESQYAIQYNKILDLSEKQLLDCDSGNDGCNGGIMDEAFRYIKNAGGIMSEADYRYSQEKSSCQFRKNRAVVTVTGWKTAGNKDEETIKKMLIQNGPVSGAVNGDNMQNYSGGIMGDSYCPSNQINHAILIVGYGESDGQKYWIIKNSWGENWGENGFFRLARNQGMCGIDQYAVSAVIG